MWYMLHYIFFFVGLSVLECAIPGEMINFNFGVSMKCSFLTLNRCLAFFKNKTSVDTKLFRH